MAGVGEDRGLDVAVIDDGIVAVGLQAQAREGGSEDEDQPPPSHAWLARFEDDGALRWTADEDPGGSAHALASGVAVDAMGRIAVAGAVYSADEGWDIWVAVYDPGGALQWERIVAGEAGREDQGVGVAVGEDGELVVAGYVMLHDGTTDAWVRGYSAAGEVAWTHTHDGPAAGIDVATDVAIDPVRGPVAVGYETGEASGTDVWVRALTMDGEPRWTAVIDGPGAGADRGTGVTIAGAGDVVAVGSMAVPGHTVDAWVGAFTADGAPRWEQRHDGPAMLGDGANDVAAFADGSVVVGGYEFVDGEAWDVWIRRLDAGGGTSWTHRHAHTAGADDLVAGIGVDAAGDVFAVGSVATHAGLRGIWLRKIAG